VAVEEPYSSLFNAIKAALVHADGPFPNDDQVEFWVDDGAQDFAPSEELKERLTRAIPAALISDSGSEAAEVGGGDEVGEECTITIHYAVQAPTYAAALQGDGTTYWGEFAVRKWIINKLAYPRLTGVTGWAYVMIFQGRRAINLERKGLIAWALSFAAVYIHDT